MEYRILYFYKKENTCYREKRGETVSLVKKEPGGEGWPFLKIFYCGIPEYRGAGGGSVFSLLRKRISSGKRAVQKNRKIPGEDRMPWDAERLLRLMQNCCGQVSADACYLEERFERTLEQAGFPHTFGRPRMCGGLIKKMTGKFQGIDGILYLCGDPEERAGELPIPEKLLRKLRFFFFLGEKREQYAVLEENLWQEYGMPLLAVKSAAEAAACRIKRLLVLDDRREGAADLKALPPGCVYLDLWSDAGRQEQIGRNRADIKYVSEYLYLRQNFQMPES